MNENIVSDQNDFKDFAQFLTTKVIELIYNHPLLHTSIWGLVIGWFFILEGLGLFASVNPTATASQLLYPYATILFNIAHLYASILIFNSFLIRPFIKLCAIGDIKLGTLNINECDMGFGVRI